MKLLVLVVLIVPMLSEDRAEYNARRILQIMGWWGVPVQCVPSVDSYVCVAARPREYAVLRCSGDYADWCTVAVYGSQPR